MLRFCIIFTLTYAPRDMQIMSLFKPCIEFRRWTTYLQSREFCTMFEMSAKEWKMLSVHFVLIVHFLSVSVPLGLALSNHSSIKADRNSSVPFVSQKFTEFELISEPISGASHGLLRPNTVSEQVWFMNCLRLCCTSTVRGFGFKLCSTRKLKIYEHLKVEIHISKRKRNFPTCSLLFLPYNVFVYQLALVQLFNNPFYMYLLFHSVSIPGHHGALGISMPHEALNAWQIFGVEFVLTFLVVFTIFATLDVNRKSLGSDSMAVGIAYLAASLAGVRTVDVSLRFLSCTKDVQQIGLDSWLTSQPASQKVRESQLANFSPEQLASFRTCRQL